MLTSQMDPIAISLQETFQRVEKLPNFPNYSYYSIPAQEANGTAHGGVAILIKHSTPSEQQAEDHSASDSDFPNPFDT